MYLIFDLILDFVVLVVNWYSGVLLDVDYNYGYSCYEMVVLLFFGVILIVVGIGMFWCVGDCLVNFENILVVYFFVLIVVLMVFVFKEVLFCYMLCEVWCVCLVMFVVNVWYVCLDVVLLFVVVIGIVGSLVGVWLFDLIVVVIVGFMVVCMGWMFGYDVL